jgi:hypothetical protein
MKTLNKKETQMISGGEHARMEVSLSGVPMSYVPMMLSELQKLQAGKGNVSQFMDAVNNAGLDTSKFTTNLYYS